MKNTTSFAVLLLIGQSKPFKLSTPPSAEVHELSADDYANAGSFYETGVIPN